jgi:DNA repair exonuclease SbcCD ATPase subunit
MIEDRTADRDRLAAERGTLVQRRAEVAPELAEVERQLAEIAHETSSAADRALHRYYDPVREERHSGLLTKQRHLNAEVTRIDVRLRTVNQRLGEAENDITVLTRNAWKADLTDPQLRMLADRLDTAERRLRIVTDALISQGVPLPEEFRRR